MRLLIDWLSKDLSVETGDESVETRDESIEAEENTTIML